MADDRDSDSVTLASSFGMATDMRSDGEKKSSCSDSESDSLSITSETSSSATLASKDPSYKSPKELCLSSQEFAKEVEDSGFVIEHPHRINRSTLHLLSDPTNASTSTLRNKKEELCRWQKTHMRQTKDLVKSYRRDLKFWTKALAKALEVENGGFKLINEACTELFKARLAEDEDRIKLWQENLKDLCMRYKRASKLTPKLMKKFKKTLRELGETFAYFAPREPVGELDRLMQNMGVEGKAFYHAGQAFYDHITDFGDLERYEKRWENVAEEREKNELGLACVVATKGFRDACLALAIYQEAKAVEGLSREGEYLDDIAFLDGEIAKLTKEIGSRRSWFGMLLCFS